MDDLDRLLRELDATDSAVLRGALPPLPLHQATKPTSALPVAPPLLNLPSNQAVIKRVSLVPTKVAHRPSLQISAPLSQLDSLVRELTDLKELVTSDPSDELAKESSEPSYTAAANDSKAAKLPRQPSGKRGLDATNQLDLLMGHLSQAVIDVGMDEDDADMELDSARVFKHESKGANSNAGALPEKQKGRPSTRPSITVAAESIQISRQPKPDGVPPRSAEPPAVKLPALPLPKSTIPPPPSPLSPGPSTCHNCKEPIEGPSLSALGKSFHVEHFVCSSCSRHVKNLQFHERDGKLFCQACYAIQLPNCHYCSKPITDLCVTALGKQWHPDHFFCAQCGKVFQPGSGFLEKNGMPYCEDDYNVLFAIKCGGCNKSIAGEFVSACGKEWHIPCFVCLDCKKPFPTGTYHEHDGQPFCATHFSLRRNLHPQPPNSLECAACQKPVDVRVEKDYATVAGKLYHRACFGCSYCSRKLDPAPSNEGIQWRAYEGRCYCRPCDRQLHP